MKTAGSKVATIVIVQSKCRQNHTIAFGTSALGDINQNTSHIDYIQYSDVPHQHQRKIDR